mmetsp:Transcript_3713/g.5661  ORF Transcript_3713/g.5661 Transcript_3713/m.5661 type:complete len:352 (-) Transcript_3713:87-1142(-)
MRGRWVEETEFQRYEAMQKELKSLKESNQSLRAEISSMNMKFDILIKTLTGSSVVPSSLSPAQNTITTGQIASTSLVTLSNLTALTQTNADMSQDNLVSNPSTLRDSSLRVLDSDQVHHSTNMDVQEPAESYDSQVAASSENEFNESDAPSVPSVRNTMEVDEVESRQLVSSTSVLQSAQLPPQSILPLPPFMSGARPTANLFGVQAVDYYLDYIRRGRSHLPLNSRDRLRAEHVVFWFSAMATEDEKVSFGNTGIDRGISRGQVVEIKKLIMEYIKYKGYVSHTEIKNKKKELPCCLRKTDYNKKKMGMNFIDDRLKDLKRLNPPVTLIASSEAFQPWRSTERSVRQRRF